MNNSNLKTAAASVNPVRQRSQFTCMATSLSMCLNAIGIFTNEDEVNKVMGCRPGQGASWEDAIACAQHYGARATLTSPATINQIKEWTDRGVPVMIAWNPEGRDWSHASVVFDVDHDGRVHVADPNIPNPDETVRVLSKQEFYSKWYEKWPSYLFRRPACAIEREITIDGRQVMARRKRLTDPVIKTARERLTQASDFHEREAGASGLYGFTKATQKDCEASIRKLMRTAEVMAGRIVARDKRVIPFLVTHANKSSSLAAKILLNAAKKSTPNYEWDMTKEASVNYGMYGYPEKVCKLALGAICDLQNEAGRIASALHRRRTDQFDRITGFLDQHCKTADCSASKMILSFYPDASFKTATVQESKEAATKTQDGWIIWEE